MVHYCGHHVAMENDLRRSQKVMETFQGKSVETPISAFKYNLGAQYLWGGKVTP